MNVCISFVWPSTKIITMSLKKFLIRISWISVFQLIGWQTTENKLSRGSRINENMWRPVLSCPTNLIILRNLFLTYRESDINSRVFSLDCYQSYRGGLSCHTGLHRYHSHSLDSGHTFLFNYVSVLLSNIPLWSQAGRSKSGDCGATLYYLSPEI